jgi:dihydroneopterin aldolase
VLYQLVKDEMEKPSKLLETVAEKIAERVMRDLPAVSQVELKIAKINPPIGGKCKRAALWIRKTR